LQEKIHLNGK